MAGASVRELQHRGDGDCGRDVSRMPSSADGATTRTPGTSSESCSMRHLWALVRLSWLLLTLRLFDAGDKWDADGDYEVDAWRKRRFELPPRPDDDAFPNEIFQEIEWRRCAASPLWFLSRHWHVLTADEGVQPFRLFDYQCHSLDVIMRRKLVLILKARQIGYTALMAGFVMWWAIFRPYSTILYLSWRETDAAKVVRAMRNNGLMLLPEWMQKRVSQANRASTEIRLTNGSQILTMPSQSNPARGQTPSLTVLDEWAFYANSQAAWASVGPAASGKGSKVVAMSTANGDGTPFAEQWRRARRRKSRWVPMFFGWWARPDRDQAWYDGEVAEMEPWAAAQELPNSEEEAFRQAGMAAFNHAWMDDLDIREPQRGAATMVGEKAEFQSYIIGSQDDDRLRIWEHPPPDDVYYRYVIGSDVASGQGRDWSTAHVLGEDGRMVAMWRGHIDADLFADVLLAIGYYYRSALIGVERNNHGVTTVQRLRRLGYGNLFVSRSVDKWNQELEPQLGWITSTKTKPVLVDGLAAWLRDRTGDVPCQMSVDEFKAYRQLDTSERFGGYPHDDLVISAGIAVQMLDHVSGVPTPTGRVWAPEGSMEWHRERRETQRRQQRPESPLQRAGQMVGQYASRFRR